MQFSDILYGRLELPEWLIPFVRIPEFLRLRGVRLSNVDSLEFKDLNAPTRWEHCIGVAHLALRLCRAKGFDLSQTATVTIAALLHDIGTPPFAHTFEYIIDGYNHEIEAYKILTASSSDFITSQQPIFAFQLPQFYKVCESVSNRYKIAIDPDVIASLVIGEGDLGFLIKGSIDLDNIDNVIRASLHMGINVDSYIAYQLVDWLSQHDGVPSNLATDDEPAVKKWFDYRNQMYKLFYQATDQEHGRQAFLQHIVRRALNEGISRKSLIWGTDSDLFYRIVRFEEQELTTPKAQFSFRETMTTLINKYQLLEETLKVFEILIPEEHIQEIKKPYVINWIERKLSSDSFEPYVIFNKKRYKDDSVLFEQKLGKISIFKGGVALLKFNQLPDWMKEKANYVPEGQQVHDFFSRILKDEMKLWVEERPWKRESQEISESALLNLESIEDWSFRLSKNESLHTYPGTFVHAIPASILSSLNLAGGIILDPFGGTGQTATEAIKHNCSVVTNDSNSIAGLVCKAKFTYLSREDILFLRSVKRDDILTSTGQEIPKIEDLNKWHHPQTIAELQNIKSFIYQFQDQRYFNFLLMCFSAILTAATGRRGKQHGYFADNTPLPRGVEFPPYQAAIADFIKQLKNNVKLIEKFYSSIERIDLNIQEALARVRITQFDISSESFVASVGIEPGTISGVITSPPYLCMADYSLGQRLSYYWLYPENLALDYKTEIGSRRERFSPAKAQELYFENMTGFARNVAYLLEENGYLATIVGKPTAKAFSDTPVHEKLDAIYAEFGLQLFWEKDRKISWHRNHGYARLSEERIAIYKKSI